MTRQIMRFQNSRGALTGIFRALALVLTLSIAMTQEASAQSSAGSASCLANESLTKLLEERYSEIPVAAGLDSGGRLVELFASPDNASWTMVITTPAGESCVMAVGEYWQKIKQSTIAGPTA